MQNEHLYYDSPQYNSTTTGTTSHYTTSYYNSTQSLTARIAYGGSGRTYASRDRVVLTSREHYHQTTTTATTHRQHTYFRDRRLEHDNHTTTTATLQNVLAQHKEETTHYCRDITRT